MTAMKPCPTLKLAAALALAWLPQSASTQPASSKANAQLDCMIQPHQVVQLGSPVAGVIDRILVERGDLVVRGQALVHLGASVERAALEVARERASQSGEITVAASAQELAQRELERTSELYQQNFVSKNYLDKSHAEAKVAGGRSEQASERSKLTQREVNLAAAQLYQRTIRAPISGVVVERYLAPGEFVEQKPVLKIAAIDPLRVDVLVPAAAFGQVLVGQQATVLPELLTRRPVQATVKTVDRVIDAASNTFRVRLELPNPEGAMPAGLRCKVELAIVLPEAGARAAGKLPMPAPTQTTLAPSAAAKPVALQR
jgi:RND family efflux transporter MFP subunit